MQPVLYHLLALFFAARFHVAQPDLELVMLLRLALILLPLPSKAWGYRWFKVSGFKHCRRQRGNNLAKGQEKNNLKE